MLAWGCCIVSLLLVGSVQAGAANDSDVGAAGVFGIDMSDDISRTVTPELWRCLRTKGNYKFAIIEGWRGGNQMNSGLATAVARAWEAGFEHVDVYAFMCPNCRNSPSSVRTLVDYLKSHNVKYGMIWLDIEQCSGCWNSAAHNVEWIKSLLAVYRELGVRVGIYSSVYEWQQTMGSDASFSGYPLWYAHYDADPSFSDSWAYHFGGWTKPAMKQFADHADNSCGVSVDRNWYP
eukprot:TRINITY_DN3129_c0_g1_i1.p1 TRINITY_DN3129_c0_g1~~TRINITY_DN3129_c0_g1_i1.p1  ORF type:complete len:234 (-),score=18.79 TRINITY_DN3129_c0_g1_i1:353-1054(-)